LLFPPQLAQHHARRSLPSSTAAKSTSTSSLSTTGRSRVDQGERAGGPDALAHQRRVVLAAEQDATVRTEPRLDQRARGGTPDRPGRAGREEDAAASLAAFACDGRGMRVRLGARRLTRWGVSVDRLGRGHKVRRSGAAQARRRRWVGRFAAHRLAELADGDVGPRRCRSLAGAEDLVTESTTTLISVER